MYTAHGGCCCIRCMAVAVVGGDDDCSAVGYTAAVVISSRVGAFARIEEVGKRQNGDFQSSTA